MRPAAETPKPPPPPALTPSVPRDVFVDWEGQLPGFDQNTYTVNTTQEGFWPYVTNTSHSWQAIYEMDGVRYMLHYGGGNRWNVYDITDPRDLKLVDEETLPWTGPGFGAVTIAFNQRLGKWIAIQASETPRYFLKGRVANNHRFRCRTPNTASTKRLSTRSTSSSRPPRSPSHAWCMANGRRRACSRWPRRCGAATATWER